MISETSFNHIADLIKKADAIAIFAGAGMGVDSGLEQFRGADGLWTKYITINEHKVKYQDLMTHHAFEKYPEKAWALVGSLIDNYTHIAPHDGFLQLLDIIKEKEYFVVTSNCDEHFQKAGFEELRIMECHGSIFYMQCMNHLEKEIWLTPKMNIDFENFEVKDSLPKCPHCGG